MTADWTLVEFYFDHVWVDFILLTSDQLGHFSFVLDTPADPLES